MTRLMNLTLAALLLGCGGDDSEGGPLFSSGVEADKRVEDLSEAEVDAVCEGIIMASARLISNERMCLFMGLMFSEDAASCDQLKQMCVSGGGDPFAGEGGEGGEGGEAEPEAACALKGQTEGCAATMEEFDTCVNFTMEAVRAYVNSLSCGMIDQFKTTVEPDNQAAAPSEPAAQETPPECAPLAEKCPDLIKAMTGEVSPENQLEGQNGGASSCAEDTDCPTDQACVMNQCS
ncbi:hypothetical protein KKF91_16295 [Myxococcota bacterium]|nr:hypothetical protein [Myxococcota bacterium]MBU1432096.1 hypothetical protein [Myxococcota bacterium]